MQEIYEVLTAKLAQTDPNLKFSFIKNPTAGFYEKDFGKPATAVLISLGLPTAVLRTSKERKKSTYRAPLGGYFFSQTKIHEIHLWLEFIFCTFFVVAILRVR